MSLIVENVATTENSEKTVENAGKTEEIIKYRGLDDIFKGPR